MSIPSQLTVHLLLYRFEAIQGRIVSLMLDTFLHKNSEKHFVAQGFGVGFGAVQRLVATLYRYVDD